MSKHTPGPWMADLGDTIKTSEAYVGMDLTRVKSQAKTMTVDEFLTALTALELDWRLVDRCLVRTTTGGCGCPVVAVANSQNNWDFTDYEYVQAGRALGLSYHDTEAILKAADYAPEHDPALRKRLLAACSLDASGPGGTR